MDISDVRRENLRAIMKARFDGSQTKLADALGKVPNYISRCLSTSAAPRNRKRIGEELAREFEEMLGLERYQLDSPISADDAQHGHSAEPSRISPAQAQPEITDLQRALLAVAGDLDYGQVADLIAYARQLSRGQAQPQTHSAPVPKTTEIFAYYGLDDDERQDELLRQLGIPEEKLNSARAALGSWFANNANRRHEDRGPPDGVEARQANG